MVHGSGDCGFPQSVKEVAPALTIGLYLLFWILLRSKIRRG